jgi:hypothetical protein
MRHLLLLGACWAGLVWDGAAAPAPVRVLTHLDLQRVANQGLNETFHSGSFKDNNLAALPRGRHSFAGVPFLVGARMIQLGSTKVPRAPARVTGIAVRRRVTRLCFLHGTSYEVPAGTEVGRYTVHYSDGTRESIPVVYGKDVRNWWYRPSDGPVTRGKLAWEGSNPAAKGRGAVLRLYLRTWHNPHTGKAVQRLDYTARGTPSAPFCVAITAEGPP